MNTNRELSMEKRERLVLDQKCTRGVSSYLPAAKRVSTLVTRAAVCRALAAIAIAAGAACGSDQSPTGPTSSPGVTPKPNTVIITPFSIIPLELSVGVGTRVTFVNNDTVAHQIAGGPDPSNPDCREIDDVGFLVPGQSKQTAPFPAARTCEYHDHTQDPGHAHSLVHGFIVIR